MSKTPKPLEVKQFYVLLALAREPMHAYAIFEQALSDSSVSLYFSLTSLTRILGQLQNAGMVEDRGTFPHGIRDVPIYALAAAGRRRLQAAAGSLQVAVSLAGERLP